MSMIFNESSPSVRLLRRSGLHGGLLSGVNKSASSIGDEVSDLLKPSGIEKKRALSGTYVRSGIAWVELESFIVLVLLL